MSAGHVGRRRGLAVAVALVPLVAAVAFAAAPANAAMSAPSSGSGTARLGGEASAASGPASGAPGAGAGKLAVLDLVVLVDESGSETPQKVADEKATVSTIVQSLLNPASRVTVIGFGGVNHVAPGQVATDVTCVPTIASGAANLSYLASCVNKLHRRSEQEGDDTDYAAALGQAMSYLAPGSTATPPTPAGAIKVVLMMTDGAVDVHRDTAQYGVNWREGEQAAVSGQLSLARHDGVQVWPLGFGTDIGTGITETQALGYLNAMAAAGAPAVCDTRHVANQPHATWVNQPDDAVNALDQLYADAACVGTSYSRGTLGGGQSTTTLTVSIPQIASAAAISVDKSNPSVTVAFDPPSGPQWADSAAISGQDSPVEVLHLNDISPADVGTWHIRLTAPPSLASELVSATVFWQGAVRAYITANPSSANLGQRISVKLDVLGPDGRAITDPATLKGLLVGVTAAGNGLPGTVGVGVSPDGQPGEYAGALTVPGQPTTLTITGTAAGYGLYATQFPQTVSVGARTQGFAATPQFTGPASVQAGGTITGQVIFTNQTGTPRQVRLVLNVSGATATLTSPSGPVTVAPGSPPSVPFTVAISKDSPTGVAFVRVEAVDAASGQPYNTAAQQFTVTKPPGFLAKYKWDITGLIIAAVLAILAGLWRRKAVRDARNMQDLIAVLRRDGTETSSLRAPGKWSDSFRFIIRDPAGGTPQLDRPDAASGQHPEYVATRSRYRMEVRLLTPAGGEPYDVTVDGAGERVDEHGNVLAFRVRPGRKLRGGKVRKSGAPGRDVPGHGMPAQGDWLPTGYRRGSDPQQRNGDWQPTGAASAAGGPQAADGWPRSATQTTQSMPYSPAFPPSAPPGVPPSGTPAGPPSAVPPTTPQKRDDWL